MENWTRLSLRYSRATLALLALVTIGFAAGLPHVGPQFGFRGLLGDDHPAVVKLEAFIDTFGGGQPILIAWECGDGFVCEHPLDRVSVQMAHEVGSQLAELSTIRRVASAANTSVILPDEYGFAVRQLIENGEPAADFDALAERASGDALWRGSLLNKEGSAGAIVVQTVDTSHETNLAVTDSVLAAIAPYQAAGFEFSLTGGGVTAVIASRLLNQSVSVLIPVLALVIAAVLFFLTRSWQQALVAMASMGVALLWTFGLLGWLRWPQDSVLQTLAPLVLTVGVCDAVHFLTRATELEKTQRTRRAALIAAARDVGSACLVTTATTGVAFLSFTTSDLDTFVRFGAICAFGVVACLVTTFTLLPILSARIPSAAAAKNAEGPDLLARAVRHSAALTQRRPGMVLASIALLTAVSFGGIQRLNVDNNWTKSIGEESPTGRWDRNFQRLFGRSSSLDLTFTLPDSATLIEPSTFAAIDAVARRIESTTSFSRPVGLADAIARLNRALHDDDPAFDRTGDTAAANAELIEMLAFDDAAMLDTWLSIDRQTVRMGFDSSLKSHVEQVAALATAERGIDALLPAGWSYAMEGDAPTQRHFVGDMFATQMRSFPSATLLVWFLVCFFLRSIPLGTAAMVPTLLPVAWILGLMGWTGMDLDIGRTMVAAIVIGIGVDDSVHLLRRYQTARKTGARVDDAMSSAVDDCGRALVTTSLALAAGFLVLKMAAWQTISSFGLLVGLAISCALVCTILVLPAMFALPSRLQPAREHSSEPASQLAA